MPNHGDLRRHCWSHPSTGLLVYGMVHSHAGVVPSYCNAIDVPVPPTYVRRYPQHLAYTCFDAEGDLVPCIAADAAALSLVQAAGADPIDVVDARCELDAFVVDFVPLTARTGTTLAMTYRGVAMPPVTGVVIQDFPLDPLLCRIDGSPTFATPFIAGRLERIIVECETAQGTVASCLEDPQEAVSFTLRQGLAPFNDRLDHISVHCEGDAFVIVFMPHVARDSTYFGVFYQGALVQNPPASVAATVLPGPISPVTTTVAWPSSSLQANIAVVIALTARDRDGNVCPCEAYELPNFVVHLPHGTHPVGLPSVRGDPPASVFTTTDGAEPWTVECTGDLYSLNVTPHLAGPEVPLDVRYDGRSVHGAPHLVEVKEGPIWPARTVATWPEGILIANKEVGAWRDVACYSCMSRCLPPTTRHRLHATASFLSHLTQERPAAQHIVVGLGPYNASFIGARPHSVLPPYSLG